MRNSPAIKLTELQRFERQILKNSIFRKWQKTNTRQKIELFCYCHRLILPGIGRALFNASNNESEIKTCSSHLQVHEIQSYQMVSSLKPLEKCKFNQYFVTLRIFEGVEGYIIQYNSRNPTLRKTRSIWRSRV